MIKNHFRPFVFLLFANLLAGCGTPKQETVPQGNPLSFLLTDYFDTENTHTSDFEITTTDNKLRVQSIRQFTAVKLEDITDRKANQKRSVDRAYSFDEEGRLLKESIYYTGAYFFKGKKETEKEIHYLPHEKKWVETYFVLDSVSVRYRNRYDEKNRLLSSENPRSKIIFTYDSDNQLIKLTQLRKQGQVLDTLNTFEFARQGKDTLLKNRIPTNEISAAFNVPEYFVFENGYLKQRWMSTSIGDSTAYTYQNGQLTNHYTRRRNKPFRETRYTYDEKGLLTKEISFSRGNKIRTVHFSYNDKGLLTQQETHGQEGNRLVLMTVEYEYDIHGNWISKTRRTQLQDSTTPIGTRVDREITYY